MALFSDCCGALALGWEAFGICPTCKKYCDFVRTEKPQVKEVKKEEKINNEET